MVTLFKKLKKIRKGVSKDLSHISSKGHQALKEYAAKAPERRAARLEKIKQQTEIEQAKAELYAAKSKKQKAIASSKPQFNTGIGSPTMGLGAPIMSKPKKRRKKISF